MKQWTLTLKDGTRPHDTVIASSRAKARELFLREYPDRERLPKGSKLEQVNGQKRGDYRPPYYVKEFPAFGGQPARYSVRDSLHRVRRQTESFEEAQQLVQEWNA